jgi:hypothetical protein
MSAGFIILKKYSTGRIPIIAGQKGFLFSWTILKIFGTILK